MAFEDNTVGRDMGSIDNSNWEGRRRPNRISSFSADGSGNFTRRYSGPETGGQTVTQNFGADYDAGMEQSRIDEEYQQLGNQQRAVKKHNSDLGVSAFNSVMKQARLNGGRIPQHVLGRFNRDIGFDGKSRAVFGGGYTQNGDFVVDVAERTPNGVVRKSEIVKPLDQYNLMLRAPGVWNQDDINAQADFLTGKAGYGKSEIADPAVFQTALANFRKGMEQRQERSAGQQREKFAMELAQDLIKRKSSDPRGDFRRRMLMDDNMRTYLMRGTPMLDKDGNPQLGEDGNPMYNEATDEEVRKKVASLESIAFGNDSNADGQDRNVELVERLISRLYPQQTVSPQEAEIRQRQLNNALDDQRRADMMRRPQQRIYFSEGDGQVKVGNGYVVDGVVYDGQGNEIAGATAFSPIRDANGNATYQPIPRTAPTVPAKVEAGGTPKEAAPASAPSNVQSTATQGQATLAALLGKAPVAKAKPDAHAKEDARRRANAQKMASPKDKEALVRGARMELERRLRKQANTNANSTSNASGQLKVQSRFNTDEAPMLPEERRAEIAKRWYDWAEQQRAAGYSISKEEVEGLIDKELNDTIG